MNLSISSIHNPLIKEFVRLKEKSRYRKNEGLFVIEGIRELDLAIKGNYLIKTLFHCPELNNKAFSIPKKLKDKVQIVEVSKKVYEKLAYRSTTEGITAIAHTKDLGIDKLKLNRSNPLILVAEAPEKPGNIGALLRTANAAKLDAIIIANPKTDMYNPNIIRSSIGCIFTTPIAVGSTDEILKFLKETKINVYCAALSASSPYHLHDYTTATAIVVGTEATGLSEKWLKNAQANIIIPMQGEIDSLNVSVSAGILIFEATRQRNQK